MRPGKRLTFDEVELNGIYLFWEDLGKNWCIGKVTNKERFMSEDLVTIRKYADDNGLSMTEATGFHLTGSYYKDEVYELPKEFMED